MRYRSLRPIRVHDISYEQHDPITLVGGPGLVKSRYPMPDPNTLPITSGLLHPGTELAVLSQENRMNSNIIWVTARIDGIELRLETYYGDLEAVDQKNRYCTDFNKLVEGKLYRAKMYGYTLEMMSDAGRRIGRVYDGDIVMYVKKEHAANVDYRLKIIHGELTGWIFGEHFLGMEFLQE